MKTIEQQIIENVMSTLNGITNPPWHFNVVAEQLDIEGNRPRDSLAMVLKGDPRPEDNPSYGKDGYFLPIRINCTLIEPDASDEPVEDRLSLLGGDVYKAMMDDFHRGGLAHQTIYTGSTNHASESPPSVDVNFELHYRCALDDPFNR